MVICTSVQLYKFVRRMNKSGSLYRGIACFLVENTVHWVPGVRGSKHAPLKTSSQSNVIRKISKYMTCANAPSCVSKDQVEKVWTKLHEIQSCYKYMISSPQDRNGVILFGNGDVYEGCIENSTASGEGCYFFSNGDSLHGLFENGQASSSMVYFWYSTDTAVVEYKHGMIEKWVQLCLDNDVYKVDGHDWIKGSVFLPSECSLSLHKTGSLALTRRHAARDFSAHKRQMFVE